MTERDESAGSGLSRRAWLSVAGASAFLGAGLAWWRLRPDSVSDEAVERLWSMAFQTPNGDTLQLAEWRGKSLVVNFWATWCPPCVEELPMLNAFFNAQRDKGWQVLALAVDQPGAVTQFLNRAPLDFSVGIAGLSGVDLSRSLGNATGGLPFTVVLNPRGGVMARKLGKLDATDLQSWLAS